MSKFSLTKTKVLHWASERSLLKKENSLRQYGKMSEEVNEVYTELLNDDVEKLALEIGDVIVTASILAEQNGLDVEECFNLAFEKIKNRKGKTVNGQFVKE